LDFFSQAQVPQLKHRKKFLDLDLEAVQLLVRFGIATRSDLFITPYALSF